MSNIRDKGLVFFAGIVGVPWQDIARARPSAQARTERDIPVVLLEPSAGRAA